MISRHIEFVQSISESRFTFASVVVPIITSGFILMTLNAGAHVLAQNAALLEKSKNGASGDFKPNAINDA